MPCQTRAAHQTDLSPAELRNANRIFPQRYHADLHDILQARGIDTLIITGTATNVCCESTSPDAMQMNYRVILVADANATYTDAEHNATLNNMVRLYADVMTTEELHGFLQSSSAGREAAE